MPHRARLDDLSLGHPRSIEFVEPRGVIAAHTLPEVPGALTDLERAVESGLWAAGFVSYEAAPAFDPAYTVTERGDDEGFGDLPLVWFGLFEDVVKVEPYAPRTAFPAPYAMSSWQPELEREAYVAAVDTIRRHIGDGDTYQVNLTFPLSAAVSGELDEFYRDLVLAQRGAYGVHVDTGRYQVLSASPERFFRLSGDRINLRPMKGTIRRGRWPAEDARLAAALSDSEKDRAENLMIVDLLRNDLGRIATFGSVGVESLFVAERYETLWQLTSDITGRISPAVGLLDIFGALFPSGSVTGAPKVRTMEIIADLETAPRGVYCGAIGYVGPDDRRRLRAEFNVAIRTVTIDTEEGLARYGVGGAITWDSSPHGEYEEARLKGQLLVERRPAFEIMETMRWEPDRGFWWRKEHLERLAQSADYFGFLLDLGELEAALDQFAPPNDVATKVRLRVARGGEFDIEASSELESFCHDSAAGPDVRVAVAAEPVSSQNVFLFHKTTNRDVYKRRLKRYPSAEDVILVNEAGFVTESTIANVAVRRADEWVTPPIEHGLLGGIFRSQLLAEGVLVEGAITRDELVAADDVALLNSVRGWSRARLLG